MRVFYEFLRGKALEVELYAIFVAHLKVIFFQICINAGIHIFFYEFSIIFISQRIFTHRLPVDRTLRLEEVQRLHLLMAYLYLRSGPPLALSVLQ